MKEFDINKFKNRDLAIVFFNGEEYKRICNILSKTYKLKLNYNDAVYFDYDKITFDKIKKPIIIMYDKIDDEFYWRGITTKEFYDLNKKGKLIYSLCL